MGECSLVVELRDQPGALLPVVEILKELGANMRSIHHLRDKAVDNLVDVEIIMDFDQEKEKILIDKLKKKKIPLISLNSIMKHKRIVSLILGHLSAQDIHELTKGITLRKGNIDELKLKNNNMCTKIKILADKQYIDNITSYLRKFCSERELLLIM